MEEIAIKIDLPVDVRHVSETVISITSPVAPGLYVGCRTLEEGLPIVQALLHDLAAAKRSLR